MFICNMLGTTVGAAFEFYEKLDVMLVLVLTLWSTFRPVLSTLEYRFVWENCTKRVLKSRYGIR